MSVSASFVMQSNDQGKEIHMRAAIGELMRSDRTSKNEEEEEEEIAGN